MVFFRAIVKRAQLHTGCSEHAATWVGPLTFAVKIFPAAQSSCPDLVGQQVIEFAQVFWVSDA